jgi:hypothetical protein
MKLAELHPIWKEALACFEALRRLGFVSDDIYMARHTDGRMKLVVLSVSYGLIANPMCGDKFAFKARPIEEVMSEWAEAAELWNHGTDEERQSLWEQSLIGRHGVALVTDLLRYGIHAPAGAEA